jgi:neutral trehalase
MQDEAFNVAMKWIYGNYRVYQKTKQMFEKYDVNASTTSPGGGGKLFNCSSVCAA